jgi:hypothetical protein
MCNIFFLLGYCRRIRDAWSEKPAPLPSRPAATRHPVQHFEAREWGYEIEYGGVLFSFLNSYEVRVKGFKHKQRNGRAHEIKSKQATERNTRASLHKAHNQSSLFSIYPLRGRNASFRANPNQITSSALIWFDASRTISLFMIESNNKKTSN